MKKMNRIFLRAVALLLCLGLVLPVSAAEECDDEKVVVLLLARDAVPLGMLAAEAGLAVDDYALSEAGMAARASIMAGLDAMAALGDEAAHCFAEVARWSAALVGLAVEVDEGDLPELRAAGDLAEAGAQFDVVEPAHYAAWAEDSEAVELPAPELVVDVTEQAIPAPGAGTVIAVLDSGFDVDESWLALPKSAEPALSGDALAARLGLIGRESVDAGQDGAKVPYLYSYVAESAVDANAAHGTRVAALAAAHRGDEYDGAAPGAQLALMKVFGDKLADGAWEHAILSALDDALLLGADVINLSFGDGHGESAGLARAVETAVAAGVGVVAAAGNGGDVGAGSFYQNRTGETYFPTAHPDRGTLATPASLPGVLSVGAATGSYASPTVLYDAEGTRISYTDTCAEYAIGGAGERSFAELLGSEPFRYVAVPGVGKAADYAGLNVVGRVALVARGEISFAEKTQHAAAAGAIGVIVYDNDPETDGAVKMQLDDAVLPAIFVNIATGARLSEAEEGELHFPERDPSTRGLRVRAVADFSSRGWGEGFTLAPDLVALGENFIGLSVDGTVSLLEGSSYAAPQVAGALAALLSEGMELAEAELRLMNTATSVGDAGLEKVPLSLRVQGAGVSDAERAKASPLLLRGNAGGAIMQTGVGEQFTLACSLENVSGEALDVVVTPTIFAEGYLDALAGDGENLRTEAAEAWLAICGYSREGNNLCVDGHLAPFAAEITLNGMPIMATGAAISLAPGEVRELVLEVKLSAEAYAEYAAAFPNGFALEGRVAVKAGSHALSLPWAAFCGDWAAAPIVSPTAYDDAPQLYAGQGITARLVSGYEVTLGELQGGDVMAKMAKLDAALATINPRGLAEPMALEVVLLRSVESYRVEVTNEAGEVVYAAEGGALRKGHTMGGIAVAARIPLWDGSVTDNAKLRCPDGRYVITLTLRGTAGGEEAVELAVVLDSTPPELVSASMRQVGGRLALDLAFRDDEYIRAVEVADRRGMAEFKEDVLTTESALAAGRGATRTVVVDATGMYQDYIYVTLIDYAYNVTVVRLDRRAMFDAAEKP